MIVVVVGRTETLVNTGSDNPASNQLLDLQRLLNHRFA